jgi:hypothetical protein
MDLTYTNPAVYKVHIDDMIDLLTAGELEQQGVPLNQRSQEMLSYTREEVGQARIDDAVASWKSIPETSL